MGIFNQLIYVITICWFRILTLLPLWLLFFLSEIITFFVYRILRYRRKVVISNLTASFPDRDSAEIKRIARKYFRHLSVMIVENIYLRFATEKSFNKKLTIENVELFNRLYAQKRNVIVMLGHFGNWEYGGGLTRFVPYKGAAVYKKLSSPVFDKIYFDIRKRTGVEPVEMQEVFRKVSSLNTEAEPYMLFMVADQSPMRSDNQHWLTFLNQPTGVFLGSEKLARRFDMPVIYIELHRVKKGSYKIVPTLISDKPKETNPNEITEKYFKLLEHSINKSPRFWLWSHRRWKHKP